MSKNLVSLIVASLAVSAISALILGHSISGAGGLGNVIGMALASIAIAIVLVGIPAGIYWLFKRKYMPYFNASIWVVWALIAVLNLVSSLRHL